MFLVEARHIDVTFGHKSVLHQVSCRLEAQKIVTVIGPNGAGKSTFLKVILGLITPNAGSLQIAPNVRMGYMPQNPNIAPLMPLSVRRFLHLSKAHSPAWRAEVLAELRIEPLLHSPMQHLSGGEMQRVMLARSLLTKPDLLVLDEPVQGVDLSAQAELYRLIAKIRDLHHCAILMVSHDLHLVMAETDWVICMNQHVCCAGHPSMVSQDPVFLKLFGIQEPATFAVYAHHHNHAHFGRDTCP